MRIDLPDFSYLPERISRLGEISYNLWWSWHARGRALFRRLDPVHWRNTQHNPVKMLPEISPERLQQVISEEDFIAHYDRIVSDFDHYLTGTGSWYSNSRAKDDQELIAYFCAEFALHSSLPIYSGGLGLLAGDTCKEASDLGLPFVAVGCFYPEGFFRQHIEPDGSQNPIYEPVQTELTPLLPVKQEDGSKLLVSVPVAERQIKVAIWRVQAGRVPIYLMDTNIAENEPWDRHLSARLYGGDNQVRLRQEIVLGIGGVRLLRALGYSPTTYHLNEGHAAFAALELIQEETTQGLGFQEALQRSRRKLVFTTHTPVKAGHDHFPFPMMDEHFRPYWTSTGIEREQFLGLGTHPDQDSFSMTVLALKTSRASNGVSRRHGEVSRQMWHSLYPELDVASVPIQSITNGVHVPTWLSREMVILWRENLGLSWFERHDDPDLWKQVFELPDERLWQVHLELKARLFRLIRERARQRWLQEGGTPGQLAALGTLLDPEALTIGFARRFATYKRATLVLSDPDRLKKILLNRLRPVQIVFSGKAHPADEAGKFLLKTVFEACSAPEWGGRIAFIENYEKHLAHHLIQGVDVWMNNPQPPQEASGTSGQKASLNGVPNLSVLDGWWEEGFNGRNGWAIKGETDEEAADSLYDLLENQIVPLFYTRDKDGLPRGWIRTMKETILSNSARFSTRRMLKEYFERMYKFETHSETISAR